MKSAKFDAIVEARANERVQAAIRTFRASLTSAFIALGLDERGYGQNIGPRTKAVLLLLAEGKRADWPNYLWERERMKVAEELLALLSPMEQALRSLDRVPQDDDVTPGDAAKEEK